MGSFPIIDFSARGFDPWVRIWKAYDKGYCPFREAAHHGIYIDIPEHYYSVDGKLNNIKVIEILQLHQMYHQMDVLND